MTVAEVYSGDSLVRSTAVGGAGDLVLRGAEVFYKISNYHAMPAFLMSVVSGFDHWMYVSSTGGLTCGRINPENSLFPYYTDDKIHDAASTTGPQSVLLVESKGRTQLWQPFRGGVDVYRIERNLYKNQLGNKLIFEEVNHDLGLTFSYGWAGSDKFGFVKSSKIHNHGQAAVDIRLLDGLRNLLPHGVTRMLQTELSTLLDAYKQAEALTPHAAAVYTMSSVLTDQAEPSEALSATVVWSRGLENPAVLLSEDQVREFCVGVAPAAETFKKGKRGAFYVYTAFALAAEQERSWQILADVHQGPSQVAALLDRIGKGVPQAAIEQDIEAGSLRLLRLVGSADGCQHSSDQLVNCRHFSNALFNIMRGGVFEQDYFFPAADFMRFAEIWNKPLRERFKGLLGAQNGARSRDSLLATAEETGDADLLRIVLEYLPLTFSRRHGDPSRPWNQFSIDIRNPDGSDKLHYQGNWRDIFQNWEALAGSYPEFAESFISKFVNASTADGYNPYRITRDGFEWEVLHADDPWSNIGYWGDHQVNYLLKLIEFSNRHHPGKIAGFLGREIFVYADVPYRIAAYPSLLEDPRNSVTYDEERARVIAGRVAQTGGDGKLLTLADGSVCRASLLEKLLVTTLTKLGNLAPGAGIWMNTRRPEWNDANNALVGYGLSMVTLCYLRRFLAVLADLLDHDAAAQYTVADEVAAFFAGVEKILTRHAFVLDSAVTPRDRKRFMDEMGLVSSAYRGRVYAGFSGGKSVLKKPAIQALIGTAKTWLDHSIALNRRDDGLFHSYNLLHVEADGYGVEHLYEMLEGQVAVLSSGHLDAQQSLALLTALRESDIYRSDQNSYMLYPDRKLPLFQDKNVIAAAVVEGNNWIRAELASGRKDFVEQDVNAVVHFNSRFRNARELRAALDRDADVSEQQKTALCGIYESVFNHRQFTGRSGTMYKYEGLGCIYWHMVSKLLLATAEVIHAAYENGAGRERLSALIERFDDIRDGLGLHKSPALYGAFPIDPYSHTTGFSGVQQPGMTGQVKEDLITRFYELGVIVRDGEVVFSPVMLSRGEFVSRPAAWNFSTGGEMQTLELAAGSMGFTLCGVPVIYRLSDSAGIHVHADRPDPEYISGNRLGAAWSRSVFRRERRVTRLVVDLPADTLRP